jgi:hypothetical protein
LYACVPPFFSPSADQTALSTHPLQTPPQFLEAALAAARKEAAQQTARLEATRSGLGRAKAAADGVPALQVSTQPPAGRGGGAALAALAPLYLLAGLFVMLLDGAARRVARAAPSPPRRR